MGKKQIQKEPWEGHDHQSIYGAAQAFQSGNPQAAKESINSIAEQLGDIMHTLGGKVQGMLVEDWRGAAAKSLQTNMSDYFRASETGILSIRHVADRMPPLGDAMSVAKSKIEPPMNDADVAIMKKSGKSDANIAQAKHDDEQHARGQMISLFSEPVVREGDNVTDVQPPKGNNPGNITLQQPTNRPESNNGGGGGQNGGGGSGGQSPGDLSKLTDGLADKNTKPAFDQGNQSGQGQGQGAGSGGGSGGGSPQSGSGGSGSGLGSALSGLGAGSDKTGSGLPLGSTTAAGYQSPSGSGSGTGTLSGPGALRGGAGMPGGASAGTNPAGIGGAGVRGGAGMGGMGMAGMGGAHGRGGGANESDDEHETPEFLINWDNGNELFGDLPKASPGVIGDWTEHERADKQRRESEKRRYKSMGWNVDFGDDD